VVRLVISMELSFVARLLVMLLFVVLGVINHTMECLFMEGFLPQVLNWEIVLFSNVV
jgi:hypothetical protein